MSARSDVCLLALLCCLPLCAGAQQISGVYTGAWSGESGAGGSFRISITNGPGSPQCDVVFTVGSTEVKTTITRLRIDGPNLEVSYQFDLYANKLESTVVGHTTAEGLEGTYSTKAVADGSPVDRGEWKAKRKST